MFAVDSEFKLLPLVEYRYMLRKNRLCVLSYVMLNVCNVIRDPRISALTG